MEKLMSFFIVSVLSVGAFAQSKIKVEVNDLTNLANSSALEACGTAIHADGVKPLLVTIKHDESVYTTVTSEDGKWCVVFKRWNNSGNITATASTLDFRDKSVTSK